MCQILGLDPDIPYWINSQCTYDIEAVCYEVINNLPPGRGTMFNGGPDPGQFHNQIVHDWLLVRNPNYKAIIKDLSTRHNLRGEMELCSQTMINWGADHGWRQITKDLPEVATLWNGPGHANINQLRVGVLDLPSKWVHVNYRDSHYISKFITLTDHKSKL